MLLQRILQLYPTAVLDSREGRLSSPAIALEYSKIASLEKLPPETGTLIQSRKIAIMNNHHHNEMYYDHASSRSPGSHRHQQQMLHRQPSRRFEAYGQMPNTVYTPDDQSMRYETNRFDRMNGQVQGNGYGYELPQAQTWNPNAFSTNNNFAQPFVAATGRMKSQTRGRSTLPTVCTLRS